MRGWASQLDPMIDRGERRRREGEIGGERGKEGCLSSLGWDHLSLYPE